MHAESSRAGAAREAQRLRSQSSSSASTAPAPFPSSPAAAAGNPAIPHSASSSRIHATATPSSSSSSAAASPRTPHRAKARSSAYGDRFIPSRDGSDMQAAYQLMGDELSAPSRSKRKLTADMDAQKEEANQAFSSLLETELFGMPTPPRNHSRAQSASSPSLVDASMSSAHHHHHHQQHHASQRQSAYGTSSPASSSHPRRPRSGSATAVSAAGVGRESAGQPAVDHAGTGTHTGAAASVSSESNTSDEEMQTVPGAGSAQTGPTSSTGLPASGTAPAAAAQGWMSWLDVGTRTGAGPIPTALPGAEAPAATSTAGSVSGSGSRAGTPVIAPSGSEMSTPSIGSLPASASAAAAAARGGGGGTAGLGMAMGIGIGSGSYSSTTTMSAAVASTGIYTTTDFSGAPTPTTPTKRNLLSYRSRSVGRFAGRTMMASAAAAGSAAAVVGEVSSSSSSSAAAAAAAAGDTSGMRGVGGRSRFSAPGTPQTPSMPSSSSAGGAGLRRGGGGAPPPDDDVDMVLLSGGSSMSGLGVGAENIGLARSGANGVPHGGVGLFGGSGSSGAGGTGSSSSSSLRNGSGNGPSANGVVGMDATIDSPTHKAYSLSPVKLESQRMLLSPRRTPRTMSKVPYKVLDAPELADDFYLNLVDWSPSNVLGVGLNHCVYLWSAKTAQVSKLVDLSQSKDRVTGLSWAGRGPHIAVGTDSGLVQIWDSERMKLVRTHRGHTGRVGALAWNEHILSSGSRDRMIFHHDVRVRDQYVAALPGHRQEVCGLKWNTESNQLASGGNDNKLMIWDGLHTTPLHRFTRHEAAIKALAWSPHQQGLLASGGGTADMKIRFWNTLTGQMLQEVDTGSQVCNLMWSRTANEIVSTHGYSAGKVQNQIQVWRYPTMQPVATLTGHTMRVLYLAMSPDGETIVTGAGDETLRFWDLNTPSKSQLEKRNESAAFNAFAKIR